MAQTTEARRFLRLAFLYSLLVESGTIPIQSGAYDFLFMAVVAGAPALLWPWSDFVLRRVHGESTRLLLSTVLLAAMMVVVNLLVCVVLVILLRALSP